MVFVRVAELGSFTAAATQLGLGRPAVSSAVAALEESLGVTLMHRSTRRCTLTPLGRELLARGKAIRELANDALKEAETASEQAVGTLRLAAPAGLIAERLVGPVLAELVREHGVVTELQCTDQRVSLVGGGYDAAIRVGTPREPGLTMRRVGRTPEVIVAAPELAATIERPEHLQTAHWVVHARLPRQFVLQGPGRRRVTITPRPAITVDDSAALLGAATHGGGLALLPLFACQPELQLGTLVRVFEDRHARTADVFVLMPSRKNVPTRVKLLIEALARALVGR